MTQDEIQFKKDLLGFKALEECADKLRVKWNIETNYKIYGFERKRVKIRILDKTFSAEGSNAFFRSYFKGS